ncbi:hypothetical protein [Edaphovirga cremea]|uniref:hypothetical protein n=1 Tax=Edaphovirga cremea TaxID=2267246 RepID=UPI003989AFC1
MPATAQQLTSAQQKLVLPKRRPATGQFDVRINSQAEIYQTKTLQHDAQYAVYRVEGRQADNATTIREILIQLPDTTRPASIDLAKQDENGAQVWFSAKSPAGHFTVKCIQGTLLIMTMSGSPLAIKGSLNATTEKNTFGQDFFVQVDLNLTS